MRCKRILDAARKEEVPQRTFDPEPVQRLLLSLPAIIPEFRRGLADRAGLARLRREAAIEDDFGRMVVAIHMGGRERQL